MKSRSLPIVAVLTAFLLGTWMVTSSAQLQQSGGPGSTVTANQGTAAGASGRWPVYVTDGTNTMPTGDAAARTIHMTVDNASLPVTQSGTFTVQPGNTANTTAWFVKNVPVTPCGTTVASQALAAVPTSSTAVFSSTTCLWQVYFNNTNAIAQTVTLTDNQGTPLTGVGGAFSIPGLSNMLLPFQGLAFTSGVKWTAGGTGITGAMYGFQ